MQPKPTVGLYSMFRDIFFKFWRICQVVICAKAWRGGDLQKRRNGWQTIIIAMKTQSRTFAARPCPCNHYPDKRPSDEEKLYSFSISGVITPRRTNTGYI